MIANSKVFYCALLVLPIVVGGCQLPEKRGESLADIPRLGQNEDIDRVLTMWKPIELVVEGKLERGFSGQLMFFGSQSAIPGIVDNEIRIALFAHRKHNQRVPIHNFDFDAPSFNLYRRDTPLGPIYSIFLPYEFSDGQAYELGVMLENGTLPLRDSSSVVVAPDFKASVAKNGSRAPR